MELIAVSGSNLLCQEEGYIRNVLVEDLQMVNVKYPFHFCLNWNPASQLL